MTPTQPLVTAVILNTNKREDTLACLESLQCQDYPNLRILVLDNASSDGSVEAIRALFPQVRILPLAQNKGYAGNNNVGIQAALDAGADWVFVLNEDIVLDPCAVSKLMQEGAHSLQVGILGPLVYHFDEPQVIQSAGGLLDRNWQSSHHGQNQDDAGQYSVPGLVHWISGCAILVRREVIEQVGLLDERFFYYWEETEWCLRARRAGWQVLFVPAAKIWHKGVQRNYRPSPNVTYYQTRNRLLALAKHRAPLRVWLHALVTLTRTWLAWTLKPQWRSMRPHRAAMYCGFRDFLLRRWGMRPS
jgi:GT2 family glycosyltransferase